MSERQRPLPRPQRPPKSASENARLRARRLRAAFLVIGDEILSGKTGDTNTQRLAQLLRSKGVALERVVTIGDDPKRIADEVRALSASYDLVFTSGGVGATHDDVTMEGVARAFACEVTHHPRFLESLRSRGLHRTHRDLARVPAGAALRGGEKAGRGRWPIVVKQNVWILPGLPRVFERKLRLLRDCLPSGPSFYADREDVPVEEEELIPLLNRLVQDHPGVQFGSYPRRRSTTRITLDGDEREEVRSAAGDLRRGLEELLPR